MAGMGDSQLKMNSIAIAVGGGVRVGLEDNIWLDQDRKQLARNSDLLKRIRCLIEANHLLFHCLFVLFPGPGDCWEIRSVVHHDAQSIG